MTDRIILDASALLCLLDNTSGADRIAAVLPRSVIGAASFAEVVSDLCARGLSAGDVREALGGLHLDVRPMSAAQAMAIGDLHPDTHASGLSLGTRACLTLANEMEAEVYTADAALAKIGAGVVVTDVRN